MTFIPDASIGATGATVPAQATQAGGRAATANPTAIADGQMAAPMLDKMGRAIVVLSHARELAGNVTTKIMNTTAETMILPAVASTFLDIVGLQITNVSPTTQVSVTIKDSSAGTTQKVFDLAANGGIVVSFHPALKQGAVNNNWTATLSVGTVIVNVNVDYVKNI